MLQHQVAAADRPGAGSVLLLHSAGPGSVVSPNKITLPNTPAKAPYWSGHAQPRRPLGTWDVAAFAGALAADPDSASFATVTATFSEACLLESRCGSDDIVVRDVFITDASYDPATQILTLAVMPEDAESGLILMPGPRPAVSVDVAIQSYRTTTFMQAMPANPDYRPLWFDFNQTEPVSPPDVVKAAAAQQPLASPLLQYAARTSLHMGSGHSLKGATLKPSFGNGINPNTIYSLVIPASDLRQHLPFYTEDSAAVFNDEFAGVEHYAASISRVATKNKGAVKALLSMRTGPASVINAPIWIRGMQVQKDGSIAVTLYAEQGHFKLLQQAQAALQKAGRAITKAAAAAQVAASAAGGEQAPSFGGDVGLRLMTSVDSMQLGVSDIGCSAISSSCPPPYLGTSFVGLTAFPFSEPPASPVESGIISTPAGVLASNWMPNRSPFSDASITAAAETDTVDTKCDLSMSTESYTSSTEMRRSWSTEAEVGAEFFGITASASTTYKSISQDMASSKSMLTTGSITCITKAFTLPPNLAGLELSQTFVESVVGLISSGNDIRRLYSFYESFGTHFTRTINLGGYSTMTMSASAASLNSFESSDLSVEASMKFSFASAKDKTTFSSSVNSTAESQGWSWTATEAPPGASISWENVGDGLSNPPVPNSAQFKKQLDALPNGIFDLSPIRFSLLPLDLVFNTPALWEAPFEQFSTVLNANSLAEFANVYKTAVTTCFANSGLSGEISCQLDDLELNGGCGKLGYPNPDDPADVLKCHSCLAKPTYKGSADLAACPYTADSCQWNNGSRIDPPAFTCKPPPNGIWSFNPKSANPDPNYQPVCRTHTVGQPVDPAQACLTSPSGRYRFCLRDDMDLLLVDTEEPNVAKSSLFSALFDVVVGELGGQTPYKFPGFPFLCQTIAIQPFPDGQSLLCLGWRQAAANSDPNRNGVQLGFVPEFDTGDQLKLCLSPIGRLTASALTKKCVRYGVSGEGASGPDCTSDYSEPKWQRYFESRNWDKGQMGPYTAMMQNDGNLVVYNKNGINGRNIAWHGPWQS